MRPESLARSVPQFQKLLLELAFNPVSYTHLGGVNTKNMMDYLGFDKIVACGGTWMVKKDLINGQKWDEITAICKDAVKTMLGFELRHVGINCADEAEAERTAQMFSTVFGWEYKPGNSSVFSGTACLLYTSGFANR